ncbi:MAG: hypothetical protein LBQ36_07340, partial [Synergistaceae bacterium]|nr:hypothetical protein [Synergistaceae bacterium]
MSLVVAAFMLTAAVPASGAEIAETPVVFGNPDESRGTVEIDMSGAAPGQEEEPLREERPSQGRPQGERRIQSPPILSISVEGNSEVVSDHILSVVSSKVGAPMDQNRLARDADAIFEQGFYANVDYRIVDEAEGVNVIFMVVENPMIDDIHFFGN